MGFIFMKMQNFLISETENFSIFFSESELSLRFSILVKGVIFTDFSFSSASLNEIESDVIFVMWTPATLKQAFFYSVQRSAFSTDHLPFSFFSSTHPYLPSARLPGFITVESPILSTPALS